VEAADLLRVFPARRRGVRVGDEEALAGAGDGDLGEATLMQWSDPRVLVHVE